MADLAQKLRLVPGCTVLLLDAPEASTAILRAAAPPGVTLVDAVADDVEADETRYDLLFCWPQALEGLAERFAALQWRIVPNGAIWVMMLKKPVARRRGITFFWEEMQAAALQTDLVDNKNAAFSDDEYGTRFVIRRERRSQYADSSGHR